MQTVLFSQWVKSQWQVHKTCESIYFPKHTQASQISQETICSCVSNPGLAHISQFSSGRGGWHARHCCCKCHSLPAQQWVLLTLQKPSQPTQVGNELPSWQKCARPRFHCICPASTWKFALRVCHTEPSFVPHCWDQRWQLTFQSCTNVEGWEFFYSSWAEIKHFQSISCLNHQR